MNYTHLNRDERYQIKEYLCEKMSLSEIAEKIGRSKSTLSRELKRNTNIYKWSPGKAQDLAEQRRKKCNNARRIKQHDWVDIDAYLRLGLSPEQAIHRLQLERQTKLAVSHESVYRRIYADKKNGGDLHKWLRGQKRFRKRYGSGQERRGAIKNRVSIDQRPPSVEDRSKIEHWEGDTVIGKDHQGVVVTLVERHSRFTLAERLDSKHADGVTDAIKRQLGAHPGKCSTITFDNGKEFSNHEEIAAYLGANIYFAHPYSSWERGLNENTNGLLRQYFPKKTNFKNVRQEELQIAVDKLNHRPRKCLDYRTPFEVFYGTAILPLKSTRCCTS